MEGGRPDILIEEASGWPIAIEAERSNHASAEADAQARLGRTVASTGRQIETAIALVYPANLHSLDGSALRYDRIGQEKPVIRIVHLFYQDTVEYDAYTAMEERINEFQENVGTLQPILAANLESIIRESVMDDTPLGSAGEAVRSLTPSIGFDLDDLAAATADQQDPAPLLHRNDLTYILNHPEWLPDGYHSEPRGDNHWRVSTPGGQQYTVTTNRQAHDYAAGTGEFFGPGSPAFPDLQEMKSNFGDDSLFSRSSISAILSNALLESSNGESSE